MNWGMRVLQTLALPLGYVTVWKKEQMLCSFFIWSGRRGSNSLPPPWQGGALPDELRPRNIDDNSRFFRVCQAVFFIFPQILVLPPCKCGKAMINCLFVLTNTVCKETTLWPRFTKRSHAAGPLPSFLTPTPVRPR